MIKEITEKRLHHITLYYLTRFDASAGKVRAMLKRRLMKAKMAGQEIPSNASQWIENVISDMRRLGYLNDSRYAENKMRLLVHQGKSIQFMTLKLKEDGIDADTIQALLIDLMVSDLEQARRLVARKKIGGYRPLGQQQLCYQKDLATLARAGFSYETARTALALVEED